MAPMSRLRRCARSILLAGTAIALLAGCAAGTDTESEPGTQSAEAGETTLSQSPARGAATSPQGERKRSQADRQSPEKTPSAEAKTGGDGGSTEREDSAGESGEGAQSQGGRDEVEPPRTLRELNAELERRLQEALAASPPDLRKMAEEALAEIDAENPAVRTP
jgi:hypothetical protein